MEDRCSCFRVEPRRIVSRVALPNSSNKCIGEGKKCHGQQQNADSMEGVPLFVVLLPARCRRRRFQRGDVAYLSPCSACFCGLLSDDSFPVLSGTVAHRSFVCPIVVRKTENRQPPQFLFQLANPRLQELPLRFLLGVRTSYGIPVSRTCALGAHDALGERRWSHKQCAGNQRHAAKLDASHIIATPRDSPAGIALAISGGAI